VRVSREELLKVLESLTPGLNTKESIEQSTCFVFDGQQAMTFNDEVACMRTSPLKITGAVKAKPLLDLLSKLPEDELDIDQVEDQLRVKGKGRRSGLRMETEARLPVHGVEVPTEDDWMPLPTDFNNAVGICHPCASSEETEFVLTCICIDPDCLQATNRFQIARYPIEMGLSEQTLVRADSLKKVCGFDMTEFALTGSWIHFRNPAGLRLAARRHMEAYKDVSRFLVSDGMSEITLPANLREVTERANIFSSETMSSVGNKLLICLGPDRITIKGQGAIGFYEEIKQTTYSGPPTEFLVAPRLLEAISEKSNTCRVGQGRLFIDTGKFVYVACTASVPTETEGK